MSGEETNLEALHEELANIDASSCTPAIVATLSRELGWSHVKELLTLKDDNACGYYVRIAGEERWSVREEEVTA